MAKMGLKLKGIFSSKTPDKTAGEPNENDKKLTRYWFNCINRAKRKQPAKIWDAALNRLKAVPDKDGKDSRPFVNDFRKLHESLMAFLDQQAPSFKVAPAEPFIGDEQAQKAAECDWAYLKKVWSEQSIQKAQSRKLNSAIAINVGYTLIQLDVKKWMPYVKYLPAGQVLIDSDCAGILEDSNWCGYWEDVSLEEFRSWHSDMPTEAIELIAKKAGSVLNDEEREKEKDEDHPLYATIRVYHIYARNSAALRNKPQEEEGKDKVLEKSLAEELQLGTPRRYLQFVEGWESPVVNEEKWPIDLDHDEFPISQLQFNQVCAHKCELYGFTDYQQMERLDELSDDIMNDLGIASFWAAVNKFASGSNLQVDPVELNDFLNNPKTSFLQNLLDAEGNPKIKAIDRGQINPAQVQVYELIHSQAKEASSLSELMENAEMQQAKDVTALAARIIEANMHQRVNRRLGGPWGYEQSIAEDAIKVLETAHQFIPRLSLVEIEGFEEGPEQPSKQYREVPWSEAIQLISNGGKLIKLGVDAVVGEELARFWPYKSPPQYWKLSTKVVVEPGTTRSITKEQQTAIMKQVYLEVFAPFYQAIGRLDLMKEFIEMIGRLAGVPDIEEKLPSIEELKQFTQMVNQMRAQAGGQGGQAGGQVGGQMENPIEGQTGSAPGGSFQQMPEEQMPGGLG